MFTDMVGYTALGQRNEPLSLALVREQKKLVRPILARHDGREVKSIGDAFLVEFPNALDAVRCAYDIQRAVREFNFSLNSESRLHLRIGVHVGEVVESERDISGDAVNLASRIEAFADDGGVCITRQVYDHVQNKFELPFSSIGFRQLKNVSVPVELFRMSLPWKTETTVSPSQLDARRVAILPFTSMSPDPNDSYFADGVTEEIISTVSNVSGLSVISRTSIMGYKGSTKKVWEIGNELKAGTVLEGSFRKAGNKIRVTTQLIDVNSDSHVWSQNYDRELDDVFAVQSDIARRVADTLRVKIMPSEDRRIGKTPTKSPDAYALYLKARHYWNERSEASLREAIRHFERAIKIDPGYALAYVGVADCYQVLVNHGYLSALEGTPKAREYAAMALRLDDELGEAHAALGYILTTECEWNAAEKEFQRAIDLSPSYATAHHWYSLLLAQMGSLDEGQSEIERAASLDPNSLQIMSAKGLLLCYGRDFDAAIGMQEAVLSVDPDFPPAMANLFWALVCAKKLDDARKQLQKIIDVEGEDPSSSSEQAHAYAALGDRARALSTLERVNEKEGDDYLFPLDVAMAYHYLGDVDKAFLLLNFAVDQRAAGVASLKMDPIYDNMRKDRRFGEALKRIGLA